MEKHYICLGGCKGVSPVPGVCGAPDCMNHNHELVACLCADGMHNNFMPKRNFKKGIIFLAIAGVLVVILGMASFNSATPSVESNTYGTPTAPTVPVSGTKSVAPKTQPTAPATTSVKSYTSADVATHNSPSNCWTSINGNVYNLTTWIAQHPGGEGAILSLCGKDGSAAFDGQHGGQGRPEAILATFLVGSLK